MYETRCLPLTMTGCILRAVRLIQWSMRRLIPILLPLLLAACTHAEKNGSELSRLKLPDGFQIAVFAEADSARMMVFSPGGVLLVSEPEEGTVVALPDPKHTGKAERSVAVVEKLTEPHGISFYHGKLYVAERDKVSSYDWD